ncbi:MAG: hypothetical protein ABSG99_00195 [Sedimentisphaerales bacterium]
MNRQQKAILRDTTTVIVITVIAVAAMINLKNRVNRSEAMRAMEHLGQIVLQYREKHGSVPPESYIDRIKEELEGHVRLGEVIYRAQWIDFESTPDEILAYTEKYHSSWLFGKKYIVLRLDGRVEWMDKREFETLLAQQQNSRELEMLHKKLKQTSPPPSNLVFSP